MLNFGGVKDVSFKLQDFFDPDITDWHSETSGWVTARMALLMTSPRDSKIDASTLLNKAAEGGGGFEI